MARFLGLMRPLLAALPYLYRFEAARESTSGGASHGMW
jgi:hypothetical protein